MKDEKDNVIDITEALKGVEELKNKPPFPRMQEKEEEKKKGLAPFAVFVIEVLNETQREIFKNALWDSYAYLPDSPALVGRAYKDAEHLMRTWAGDGVLLLLIESLYGESTGEYKDNILAVGALADMDRLSRTAELRFMLEYGQAGRGIQKLVIKHFSSFANKRLGIERLYLKIFESDKTTKEILTKKQGWEKCGELPGYGYHNGQPVNVLLLTAGLETIQLYFGNDDGGDGEKQQDSGDPGQAGKQQGL